MKDRIAAALEGIVDDPWQGKRLLGPLAPYLRVRVGDYRILYRIDGPAGLVIFYTVLHRKHAYD